MISRYIKKAVHLNKWRIIKRYIFLEDFLYKILCKDTKSTNILLTKRPSLIYQCQWASPRLVKYFVSHQISAASDPKWQSFHFRSKKDYVFWSWRICAIACIKMVMNYFKLDNGESMAVLTKDCLRLGGYDLKNDKGWFHRILITYLQQKGLNAAPLMFFSWKELVKSVANKTIFIVSISENERKVNPLHEGHLVVIVGIRMDHDQRGIYYLDPSSLNSSIKNNLSFISWQSFWRVFLMKGVRVSS